MPGLPRAAPGLGSLGPSPSCAKGAPGISSPPSPGQSRIQAPQHGQAKAAGSPLRQPNPALALNPALQRVRGRAAPLWGAAGEAKASWKCRGTPRARLSLGSAHIRSHSKVLTRLPCPPQRPFWGHAQGGLTRTQGESNSMYIQKCGSAKDAKSPLNPQKENSASQHN